MNDHRDDTTPRRTPLAKPTEERTADQSTQDAGGLHKDSGGLRPGPGPELARERDADDVLNRSVEERYDTPRNYDPDENRDPTMPSDDSSLNTKI